MPSPVIDEVSRNKIWREHCKKEMHLRQLRETFSIPNVDRMQILAEKPNKVTPQTFQPGPEQLEAARTLLNSLSSVHNSGAGPPSLAPTSNREYGFDHHPLMKPNPAFQFSKTKCDITAYADAYCAFSNGVSPFARPLAGNKTQRKG